MISMCGKPVAIDVNRYAATLATICMSALHSVQLLLGLMLTVARRVRHPDKGLMCVKGLLSRCKRSGARVLSSDSRLVTILYGFRITAMVDEGHSHDVIGAAVWDFSCLS